MEPAALDRRRETPLTHVSGTGLWIVDRVVDYSGAAMAFDTADGTTVTIRFQR